MTKKRKQLKFTTTGRTLHADIDRHASDLDEELCSEANCQEVGSAYRTVGSNRGVLVCGDHSFQMKDYREF